jgi:hemoglobin
MEAATTTTPFERMGGEPAVRRLVDHFYRIMDESAQAKPIRAMHAADLSPMRERLTEYLTAWLGGPRHYFERADSKCIMSAHSPYAIGEAERDQWMTCMRSALDQAAIEGEVRALVEPALARIADALRNR